MKQHEKTSNMNSANPVIQQFIIEASLINPISDIINKLKQGEFRDCDIQWLDNKLEKFTKFACETLGVAVIVPSLVESESYTRLNNFLTRRYVSRFQTLLDYFKTF